MSVVIKSGSSSNTALINSNGELLTTLGKDTETAGYAVMQSEVDAGDVTGEVLLKSPEVSADYRLRVGVDMLLFNDSFNASTQNTALWEYKNSGMVAAQAGGTLNLNSAGTSTTTGHYAYMRTWRNFSLVGTAPNYIEFAFQMDKHPITGEVFVAGMGNPGTGTEPTDGVFIRYSTAGLYGVAVFNGNETTTLLGGFDTPELNHSYTFIIAIGQGSINFWIDDVLVGSLATPNVYGQPMMGAALPIFFMKYNASTITTSPNTIFKISYTNVTLADIATNKPWADVQAAQGNAYQGTNGGTMGGLQTYPNSTNPTTAAPSNTALTANLPAGLGGQGLATLWNVAATDMILLAYQNPVGLPSVTPVTIHITGVRITAASATAAWTAPAAGVPLFEFGLAWGNTAVSQATAETASFTGPTVKAPRRKVLGLLQWATGASPVGTKATSDLFCSFTSPVVVNPGEYVSIIGKIINGAAVATGGLFYTIDFDYYFE